MNNNKVKEIGYKIFSYIAIYLIVTLYMKSNNAFDFQNWYYVGNIASASIVYLIIYMGSDSVSYRLKEDNKAKASLDKMTISKKAIFGHAIAIVLSIIAALLLS